MRILAIGEILWDVFGADEHLGGAPLNVVVNAARLGHEAAILSGVGDDDRGVRARREIVDLGLDDRFVATVPGVPTGIATVSLDGAGVAVYDFPRPAAYDLTGDTMGNDGLIRDVLAWRPDWVVFGTLAQFGTGVRALTDRIIAGLPGAGRLYDVNLRAGQYRPEVVLDRLAQATLVKLNDDEANSVAAMTGLIKDPLDAFCAGLAEQFGLRGVCVTRGADGSVLWLDDVFTTSRAYPVRVVDTVGAGDAFSATLVHGIATGLAPADTLDLAARVAAVVAGRAGGTPAWELAEAIALERT